MFASSLVGVAIGPHFMESGHYVISVVVPFTSLTTPTGFIINLLFQIVYLLNIYGVLYIFILLFITFNEHILTEMKVMHAVAVKIGEYESQERQIELKEGKKLKQVKETTDISKDGRLLKSSNLLKQMLSLHLDIVRYVFHNVLNEI